MRTNIKSECDLKCHLYFHLHDFCDDCTNEVKCSHSVCHWVSHELHLKSELSSSEAHQKRWRSSVEPSFTKSH